jgi:hypothetical protein
VTRNASKGASTTEPTGTGLAAGGGVIEGTVQIP